MHTHSLEFLESRIAPASLLVLNDSPSGDGSLAEAIIAANASPDNDTVLFDKGFFGNPDQPRTIELVSMLSIASNLKIQGPGPDQLTISGQSAVRIFEITDGDAVTLLKVSLSGLSLRDGDAGGGNGGAIALEISKTTFVGNQAGTDGGALSLESTGPSTIQAPNFSGNHADLDGGAMVASSTGSILIKSGSFAGNVAGSDGGAIRAESAARWVVDHSAFSGNSSAADGGAFSVYSVASLTLTKNRFETNHAVSSGGAVSVSNSGTTNIVGCVFLSNRAQLGGGFFADSAAGSLLLSGSTFQGNLAEDNGGGASISSTLQVTISGASFSGNLAAGTLGEGLMLDGVGEKVLTKSTLTANHSNGRGGAVAIFSGPVEIIGSSITGNSADTSGGGITALVPITLIKAKVTGNSAPTNPNIDT